MNWFRNCLTYEQGRAVYRKLAQEHHPDRGGDLLTMQEINAQWTRFKKSSRPSPGARPQRPSPPGRAAPPPPRQRYRAKTRAVHMPQSKRSAFTRTVKLREIYYPCKRCRRSIALDWYPGSWKPLYCEPCRKEAAAEANRARQKRYREAHKKGKTQ